MPPITPLARSFKANGQSYYPDPNGKYTDPITGEKKSLSAINKLKEEGDWDKMSKNLSSQFLSKQPIKLIQKQLDLTYADAADEFAEICSLNNPTIKRKLLMDFCRRMRFRSCPFESGGPPPAEYASDPPHHQNEGDGDLCPQLPERREGRPDSLPPWGTFEIPELTVNNKNQSAISILGKNIRDCRRPQS